MRFFLSRIIFNSIALYLINVLIDDIVFNGSWKAYLLAGFIFALLNTFIKPAIRIISGPLIALTFGLFSILINIVMLWALTQIVANLQINGFSAYLWGTMIISAFNFLVNPLIQKLDQKAKEE